MTREQYQKSVQGKLARARADAMWRLRKSPEPREKARLEAYLSKVTAEFVRLGGRVSRGWTIEMHPIHRGQT